MSDETADYGGQRPESRSGFIDDVCSRFETAWRAGQRTPNAWTPSDRASRLKSETNTWMKENDRNTSH